MHSSRMHTTHSLTGGLYLPGGVTAQGVYLPGGMYLPVGCTYPGGVPAQDLCTCSGGVPPQGGVPTWAGTPPMERILDTCYWNYYLAPTSLGPVINLIRLLTKSIGHKYLWRTLSHFSMLFTVYLANFS